jgi:hypothetical protein
MLPEWISPLVAKAKIAGLLGAALAAGGLGGTVALTHVTPAAHQTVRTAAATTADPEPTDAATPSAAPESPAAQDPESGPASQDTESGPAPDPSPTDCPAGVKNHGTYVSSVGHSAVRGKDGAHGDAVSAAARSDCGKKAASTSGDTPGSTDPESGDASGHQPGAAVAGTGTHAPAAPHAGASSVSGSSKDKTGATGRH